MDLENQKRVKEFAEQYGPENVVVLLGAAEGEASGLAAETVTAGDPTYAGPLTGVSLGLTVYHVCEPEVKAEFDPAVYDEQISMMEMVLDVDDIISEIKGGKIDFDVLLTAPRYMPKLAPIARVPLDTPLDRRSSVQRS